MENVELLTVFNLKKDIKKQISEDREFLVYSTRNLKLIKDLKLILEEMRKQGYDFVSVSKVKTGKKVSVEIRAI